MATQVIERRQPAQAPPVPRSRVAEAASRAAPAVGALALAGVVVCGLTIVVDTLAGPSFVANDVRIFRAWPAGFLNHLGGDSLHPDEYGRLTVAMFLFYVLAVACATRISARWAIVAVASLHLAFLATPPLESKDVFNYIDYARLGVLHDMNPYAHAPHDLVSDPAFRMVGWPGLSSPYGPLYTLVSYIAAPFGIGGGLWVLKTITVAAAGGCLALVWRGAKLLGRDPVLALVLVGLNPAWLVWGLGGSHNDFLMVLLELAGVLLWLERREAAGAATAVLAAGIKIPALVVAPILVAASRDRRRALYGALGAVAALALLSLAVFGSLSPLTAFHEQSGLFTNRSLLGYLARFVSRPLVTEHLPGPAIGVLAAVVAACVVWAWRTRDALAPAAWATAAVVLALTWEFPWYVGWLLPLAALVRDWRIKAVALMFTAVLLVAYVPLAFFLA